MEALADLAEEGIHDPATMPFLTPWTDAPPAERARGVLQWCWRLWGGWSVDDWTLALAVCERRPSGPAEVVGVQGVGARRFALLREVDTQSWLGLRYHRLGIGTEMRVAVLHLAFVGLGAQHATSSALEGNAGSLGVSRRLGYTPDGVSREVVRGRPVISHRLRLTRAAWEEHRGDVEVQIEGLDRCREMFVGPAAE